MGFWLLLQLDARIVPLISSHFDHVLLLILSFCLPIAMTLIDYYDSSYPHFVSLFCYYCYNFAGVLSSAYPLLILILLLILWMMLLSLFLILWLVLLFPILSVAVAYLGPFASIRVCARSHCDASPVTMDNCWLLGTGSHIQNECLLMPVLWCYLF